MSGRTNKLAYKRHAYSGPRKSFKRVRGGLRHNHGEESRLKAWRSEEMKKPVNEEIVIDNSITLMSNPCELPPCPPCPPMPPSPCPQVCPPPPPLPPCRVKPIMRGLHWSQTTGILTQALTLAACGGFLFYFLVAAPRIEAYKIYYARGEFEDWADEMARKGLFQSVPPDSLKDNQHMKK